MPKNGTNRSWMCSGHQVACWLVVLCLLTGAGCAADHSLLDRVAWEQSQLLDLTHAFGADTIVWPTEQDFRLVLSRRGRRLADTTMPRIVWRWQNMVALTSTHPFTSPRVD